MVHIIQNWVSSISAITVIVAMIYSLAPKNSAGRTVLFCGSIVLIIVLISPLKKFDESVLDAAAQECRNLVEAEQRNFEEKNENIKKDIIEKTVKTYILQRADETGTECDIDIEYRKDGTCKIELFTNNDTNAQKLSKIMEECGIEEYECNIQCEEGQ